MQKQYRVLGLGASYGSLLAIKLVLAGHKMRLVCLPNEVEVINAEGIRVRMPVGHLNHFTATCGPDIVRGDRLPADLKGDLLFAEPVGRLIRRTKIVKNEGLTQLRNAYQGSEFILSSDPLFRPVNMRTAPDGTVIFDAAQVAPTDSVKLAFARGRADATITRTEPET